MQNNDQVAKLAWEDAIGTSGLSFPGAEIVFFHPTSDRNITEARGFCVWGDPYNAARTTTRALCGRTRKHPDDGMPWDQEVGERVALQRAIRNLPKHVRMKFWRAFKRRWPNSPVQLDSIECVNTLLFDSANRIALKHWLRGLVRT